MLPSVIYLPELPDIEDLDVPYSRWPIKCTQHTVCCNTLRLLRPTAGFDSNGPTAPRAHVLRRRTTAGGVQMTSLTVFIASTSTEDVVRSGTPPPSFRDLHSYLIAADSPCDEWGYRGAHDESNGVFSMG